MKQCLIVGIVDSGSRAWYQNWASFSNPTLNKFREICSVHLIFMDPPTLSLEREQWVFLIKPGQTISFWKELMDMLREHLPVTLEQYRGGISNNDSVSGTRFQKSIRL